MYGIRLHSRTACSVNDSSENILRGAFWRGVVDARPAALLRIALGLLAFADFCDRLRDFNAFYTLDGLVAGPSEGFRALTWSLFSLTSSRGATLAMFLAGFPLALAFALGYRTRVANAAALGVPGVAAQPQRARLRRRRRRAAGAGVLVDVRRHRRGVQPGRAPRPPRAGGDHPGLPVPGAADPDRPHLSADVHRQERPGLAGRDRRLSGGQQQRLGPRASDRCSPRTRRCAACSRARRW